MNLLDLINKYKKQINLILHENTIICGKELVPVNKETNLEHYISYQDINKLSNEPINNDRNIIDLDNDKIYFVIEHQFQNHFHHEMNELVLLMQFFINELENKKIHNKTVMVITNKHIYHTNFMEHIKTCIDDTNYFYSDNCSYYKGNFLFLSGIFKNVLKFHDDTNLFSIIKKLIQKAKDKYEGTKYYDHLWISRRNLNIKTYWHKRFNTSIINNSKIYNKIKEYFHEIHFPTQDLLYQIYLMSKVKIVFAETGTSMNNAYFMEQNTVWLSDNEQTHTIVLKNICMSNNITCKCYPTVLDTKSEYWKFTINTFNKPYKFENDDDFLEWFKLQVNTYNIPNLSEYPQEEERENKMIPPTN